MGLYNRGLRSTLNTKIRPTISTRRLSHSHTLLWLYRPKVTQR